MSEFLDYIDSLHPATESNMPASQQDMLKKFAINMALESDNAFIMQEYAMESIFSKLTAKREAKAEKKAQADEEYKNPTTVINRIKSIPPDRISGYAISKTDTAKKLLQQTLAEYNKNPGKGRLMTSSELKTVAGYPVIITTQQKNNKTMYTYVMSKDGKEVVDVLTLRSWYKMF